MIPRHRVPRHFAAASVSSPGVDSASAASEAVGTSPGASAETAAVAAKVAASGASPRADGKAPSLDPGARPAPARDPGLSAGGADGKSLTLRVVERSAAAPPAPSPAPLSGAATPPQSPTPAEFSAPPSPAPETEYERTAAVLTNYFERERGTFSADTADSIDHFLSYGEWGIAHSVIARVVLRRAESGEDVSSGLLAAANWVTNNSD